MSVKKTSRYKEISSVTPFSVEECAQRLQKLGEYRIVIVTKHLDPDLFLFEAQQWEDNQITAAASGQLTRWEGTSTRIKMQQQLSERQQRRVNRLRKWIPIVACIIGFGLSQWMMLDARSTVILTGVALLIGLIPGPALRRYWMSQESDDLLWIIGSALKGKLIEPYPRIRSLEEIGLDDELGQFKSR